MASSNEVVYTLTGNNLGESEKAVKFEVFQLSGTDLDSPITQWFPKSQIRKMFRDPNTPNTDWIIVTEWILRQKQMV